MAASKEGNRILASWSWEKCSPEASIQAPRKRRAFPSTYLIPISLLVNLWHFTVLSIMGKMRRRSQIHKNKIKKYMQIAMTWVKIWAHLICTINYFWIISYIFLFKIKTLWIWLYDCISRSSIIFLWGEEEVTLQPSSNVSKIVCFK